MIHPVSLPAAGWKLWLQVADPAFGTLLTHLLKEWGYRILEKPVAGEAVLVEEGIPVPEGSGEMILLGGAAAARRGALCKPPTLEALWTALETKFHRHSRAHIRIPLSLAVTATCRGCRLRAGLLSLSERGARFSLDRELAQGEAIGLRLELNHPLEQEGRVIYALCRGEGSEQEGWEVGVVFDPIGSERRRELRQEIVARYLEGIRPKLPDAEFRAGLAGFNIARPVLERLGCL